MKATTGQNKAAVATAIRTAGLTANVRQKPAVALAVALVKPSIEVRPATAQVVLPPIAAVGVGIPLPQAEVARALTLPAEAVSTPLAATTAAPVVVAVRPAAVVVAQVEVVATVFQAVIPGALPVKLVVASTPRLPAAAPTKVAIRPAGQVVGLRIHAHATAAVVEAPAAHAAVRLLTAATELRRAVTTPTAHGRVRQPCVKAKVALPTTVAVFLIPRLPTTPRPSPAVAQTAGLANAVRKASRLVAMSRTTKAQPLGRQTALRTTSPLALEPAPLRQTTELTQRTTERAP